MESNTALTDAQEAMREAVRLIGGHAAVATLLGYDDRRNVWPWTSLKKPITPDLAPAIERGTGGKVVVERLCPGKSWVRIKDKDWPNPAGRPLLDPAAPQKVSTAETQGA